MSFDGIIQPAIIKIDESLRLRTPDKSEWKIALPWYQNPKVLYFSEGVTNKVYNNDVINRMYTFLSNIGELYFIEAFEAGAWKTIGDVTLSAQNMPVAIGDENYWGMGIGKKVLTTLIERAKSIGLKRIYVPAIYSYNTRSKKLFTSMGFVEVSKSHKESSFELEL